MASRAKSKEKQIERLKEAAVEEPTEELRKMNFKFPQPPRSGLKVVRDILSGVDDIHFSELTSRDVIRHALVGRIVDAYAKHEARLERGDRPTTTHRNRE
jgi:phosphate starvation-inducible protein PhoH